MNDKIENSINYNKDKLEKNEINNNDNLENNININSEMYKIKYIPNLDKNIFITEKLKKAEKNFSRPLNYETDWQKYNKENDENEDMIVLINSMATIEFNYETINIPIQCSKNDKIKTFIQKFSSKIGVDPSSLIFIYNGNNLTNIESTFDQICNKDDQKRKKMNVLVEKYYASSNDFIFEKCKGADEQMKEFSKMIILLAMQEYPDDDEKKSEFIASKFDGKYGNHWSVSFIKEGGSSFLSYKYSIKILYKGYKIKIAQTSLLK